MDGKNRKEGEIRAIATIALAQLLGTSLWFSINGVADELTVEWHVSVREIGILTSAVQVGFIVGTTMLALTNLADKYDPSRVFAVSAIAGGGLNLYVAWGHPSFIEAIALRAGVGVCLAGIYPIGMKLMVTWSRKYVGSGLSLLVGMLTLGTALPHGLSGLGLGGSWQGNLTIASALAVMGAIIIWVLGEGPQLYENVSSEDIKNNRKMGDVWKIFKIKKYREAAGGYFGHMWELYALWTLVPLYVGVMWPAMTDEQKAMASAGIIGAGAIGCVIGGGIARKVGSEKVAVGSLVLSGVCCLAWGMGIQNTSKVAAIGILLIWGATVVADSPHFSALTAEACPKDMVGAGLAIQNAIGFGLTIVSIEMVTVFYDMLGVRTSLLLMPGPIVGLMLCAPLVGRRERRE